MAGSEGTVRYLNMMFPSITMNNLIAISTEKCFSTRGRAQFFHCVVVVPSTIALNGIKFEPDNTHHTVFCEVDNSYISLCITSTYRTKPHLKFY